MILRHSLFLWSICLMTAVSAMGCRDEAPAANAPPPKVSVRHPEKRDLPEFMEFNGRLVADQKLEVRARVQGHIKKRHFEDGTMVSEGQMLFEIDPRPFEAALKDAQADLASAQANLDLAIKEYARTANLARTGAASREEADVWKAKQAVATANKQKAEAVIAKTELDLEYSKITADIGGRIGKAELTEGNLVNAGGSETLLTTITSLDPIRVTFEVDERRVQERIRQRNTGEWLANLKDAKVQIKFALDGEKEFSHPATLVFGDNKINPQTGTLAAYGTAENKKGSYIDGARIRVRVPIGADANTVVLVPDTAILSDQDKRYVLILDDKNNARRRNVTLGRLDDNGMRVIKPAEKLAEGEQMENWWVIEDNLQRVRLNYPVEPQKLEAAQPAST